MKFYTIEIKMQPKWGMGSTDISNIILGTNIMEINHAGDGQKSKFCLFALNIFNN